jgi:segregation and condensation protein B
MTNPTGPVSPATELIAAVEAVLFAAAEPVHPKEVAAAFEGATESDVAAAIDALRERYSEGSGGLTVEQVAGAFRLATKPEVGAIVRQFFRQRNRTRLSPAGLETLAIIAYRQPITAPEIQAMRGVDPSGSLKSLLEKSMVRILGRKKVVGNPLLYGTTKQFLVHFGLNRLEDLPSIEEFDQFLGALQGGQEPLFGDAMPDSIETTEAESAAPLGPAEDE